MSSPCHAATGHSEADSARGAHAVRRLIAAGYEFGHRDDYQGRRPLPHIKVDADSRNSEE